MNFTEGNKGKKGFISMKYLTEEKTVRKYLFFVIFCKK